MNNGRTALGRLIGPLDGALGRNSGGVLVNQLILLATGLLTFKVIGSRLGVDGYGLYASAVAISHVVGPFSQLGSNHLSVRTYARTQNLALGWQQFLGTTVAGGVVGTLMVVLLQPLIAPELDRVTAGMITASEVIFYGIIGASGLQSETVKKSFVGARIRIGAAVARLSSLGVFVLSESTSVRTWSVYHLVSHVIGALVGIWIVERSLDAAPGLRLIRKQDIRLGLGYAANQLANGLQNDADKIILAIYGFTFATGIYAAGYRLALFAALPLTALVGGTYSKFFELGTQSVGAARSFAVKLTRLSLILNAGISATLFVAAPLIVRVFNDDFGETVEVLRWLCVLPLLKTCQIFAANALTGADQHRVRLFAILGTTMLNIGLNLLLIPGHTWRGAVFATLLSELLLAIALWVSLNRAVRMDLRPASTRQL